MEMNHTLHKLIHYSCIKAVSTILQTELVLVGKGVVYRRLTLQGIKIHNLKFHQTLVHDTQN